MCRLKLWQDLRKKTYEKLTSAGWYHNRRVSINDVLIKLNEINYNVNDTIKDFLIEFDGISLEYSNRVHHFDFETKYIIYNIENFNLVNNLTGSYCLKVGAFCNNDIITAISRCCNKFNQPRLLMKLGVTYMKKYPELDDVQPELAKQIRDIMVRWYKGISNKELIANQLEAWALIPEPKTQYYTPAGEIAGELARLHIIEFDDYQKSLEWALLAVEARREIPSGYDYLTVGVSYFELNDLENAYKYFDLAYNEGKYNVFTNYDKKYWQFYKSEKENKKDKK